MDHREGPSAEGLATASEQVLEALRLEEAKRPAVGSRQPLAKLEAEVVSEGMLAKLRAVCSGDVEGYQGEDFRRVRGDGCCFHRAAMFLMFEWIAEDPPDRESFIRQRLDAGRQTTVKLGYSDFVVGDFFEAFDESLEFVKDGGCTEDIFADVDRDRNLVMLARLLTSGWIRTHAEDFMPFITTHTTVEQYCTETVDPLWREADQVHITALMRSLTLGVKILHLDATSEKPNVLAIPEDSATVMGCLLYRPGHYDVLYFRC